MRSLVLKDICAFGLKMEEEGENSDDEEEKTSFKEGNILCFIQWQVDQTQM